MLLSCTSPPPPPPTRCPAACREALGRVPRWICAVQGELIDTFISSELAASRRPARRGGAGARLEAHLLVAVSIPFSVLLALLLMYFTGVSANIMSLGGLSLAVRHSSSTTPWWCWRTSTACAGAHQPGPGGGSGPKQISGAVVASTLTTVCVFMPIAFTTGMVNQMMMPFALTLTYVLTAPRSWPSLVPALSRFVFRRRYRPRRATSPGR